MSEPLPKAEPLLKVESLQVLFGKVAALQDINLELQAGETLGLVGESGSGKSTLARAILRLTPAASGRVLWQGEDLLSLGTGELRQRRRDLQIVFQDPLASLNPRMSIGDALAEPLKIFEPTLSAARRQTRISEMLERVGLAADMARRYPHEFSGGQCQRIGIARAMMLRPKLLICDEAVSSLDVSVQGQIVNLLADLQRNFGMAMLFISHNLAVVRHLSHRVLVLYRGRLVEVAEADALFAVPVHPYTRELLAAVSGEQVREGATTEQVTGGCAFRPRCAYAQAQCAASVPPLEEVATGHWAACYRWREVVYSSQHETRKSD
jgi:oligopeptide transport system ATP-binding protein